MTVETATYHDHLVMRDDDKTWRWYDAFGPNVVKYLQDFVHWPVDDTTHDPVGWTNTIVENSGASTVDLTDLAGGALLITTGAQENDGYKMQLGHESGGVGENVKLEGRYPLYFGVEFAQGDVDQTDCLFGVCITDTACIDGVSDGMYFRSIDESAVLYFVTEKDSVESTASVATMTDNTYVTAEFFFDGATVTAYVDGEEQSSTAYSAATFPNNEDMRLTMEVLTGEGVANTCTIKWVRMIHLRS